MNATQDRCDIRPIFKLLLIALIVLIPATSRADIQCYQCHGTSTGSDYRPIDAASRNYSTGGFIGNHRSHMAGPANPTACIKCHNNQNYTSNHRNGFINLSSNINSSPLKGKYLISGSQVTSKTQSATPVLGTCTDINCHFETVTPQWGTELFTAPTDCNKCHGAPPSGGSTGASGNHAKHYQYYSGIANCQKCHSNNTTFQHATSAGKRNLNISFTATPNNGSGVYSGALNDYLPSQTNKFGTCRSLYCHSNGARGFAPYTSNTTATWGGSLTCADCHKSDFASGASMSSGSHGGHVNKFGGGYNTVKCVKCHALSAKADMTIFNTSNHVNRQMEIAFNNSSSAASGYYKGILATPGSPMTQPPGLTTGGVCTNVYCHSTGQGANGTWPPTYSSPAWGTGSTGDCGTCHGNQFQHVFGGTSSLSSGSHAKHLQYQMNVTYRNYERCVVCHSYQRTGFDPLNCNSALCHAPVLLKHANYEINIGMPEYFGASATYNGTTKPGDGYSTCSNVYCHSDGLAIPVSYYTPTWGNPASGACGTCHGAKADSSPASAAHAKHVGSSGLYLFACSQCHTGIVKYSTTSATYALISTAAVPGTIDGSKLHVNKTRNVRFGAGNPFGTYSSASASCRNLYCHSTGNTSVASSDLPAVYNGTVYARQTWSGTVACNSCHGRSTSNGMPDYANAGAAGSATANSHQKHVTSSAIACVECHEKTTKNNTAIRSTVPNKHVDGTNHDVYFNLSGLSPSGTYDNALKKCSATYCHGAGASLAWGGSTYCNSCHSSNAGTTGGGGVNNWGATPLSAHKLHWEDTASLPSKYANYSAGNLGSAGTYRFGCASCHNPASTAHVNGYASGSYRAQVFFGYTSPGKKPTYTYTGTAGTADNGFAWSNGNTVCNSTYCHSNGAGGAGTAVSWTTTANSATATRCKLCHNYTAASGAAIATGDHTAHVNGATYNFSCRKCHAVTTADGSSIADKTKHVNKQVNVAFNNTTTAVNGTYNGITSPMAKSPGSAYASCANTYCHSKGTSTTLPSAPNVTPTWGSTLNTTCSGCHGNDSTADFKMGTVGSAAHAKHVQAYGFGCVKCHAATVSDNRTIKNYATHVTQQVDVAFNNTTTAVNGTYNGSVTPMSKLPGSAMGACGNTYCHSNGTSVSTGVIPAHTSVTWSTGGPLPCTSCHGAGGTTGAPYYSKMMRVPTAYSGGTNWTTPGDALLGNRTFATYANTAQNPLILTTFGYTAAEVADTDAVTGLTVIVKGWAASGTTPGNQLNVQLTKDGSAGVGTAKTISLPGTTNTANAEVYATTTTTDLWGAPWTPAQVRAATFGVILKDNDTTNSGLNVDMVRIIVHTNRVSKMNNHSSAIGHRIVTCNICHDSVTYSSGVYTPNATLHVNKAYNVQASLGYTYVANGGSCATPGNGCHGPTSGKWGGTLGCVDCHNKTITRTKGRVGAILANVVGEFGLAWGHKKSGRNPVMDDDCIVCHLEGDGTSHKASARHQDGNIDLRDPDGAAETPITNISGGAFTFQRFSTSYAAGSRTSTGHTSNTDIANVVTQKFCLACHDANGAINTTARSNNGGTGTDKRPFGGVDMGANYSVVNGAVAANSMVDVRTQLASTNSSKHPVLGPLNRDFPAQNRMSVPYQPPATRGTSGTLVQGVVINCFDCHNVVGTPRTLRTVTAHGNAVTIRGAATVIGTPSSSNDVTFCKVCHAGYVTGSANHGTGSAFSSTANSGMTSYLNYGCNVCHGSNYGTAVVRPVRAQDVHGVNVLPSGGGTSTARWSGASTGTPAQVNARPYAFIRNTKDLGTHNPKKIGGSTYTPGCEMGPSGVSGPTCTNQGTKGYTAGGTF